MRSIHFFHYRPDESIATEDEDASIDPPDVTFNFVQFDFNLKSNDCFYVLLIGKRICRQKKEKETLMFSVERPRK